jgi:antitoxin component YwqK of YwqJK toxin-antitoxin module
MTPKEAFFYGLRANNIRPDASIKYVSFGPFQWLDFYASYFDKDNYIKSVHDEFKRKPYLTGIFNEMNAGINSVDFNKTFYVLAEISFGIYDTDCGCFPLNTFNFNYFFKLLDVKEVGNNKLWYDNPFVSFSLGSLFNLNDFDFVLKMKPSEAEKFVSSRKDNYGNINRKITLKIIYNITDKVFQEKDYNYYVGAYIHKLEFYDGNNMLGSAIPKHDYYDKVKIVKLKNGVDKTFFDKNWKMLNDKDSLTAGYYRITTYKDGKTNGPMTDYFINGAKQMTGFLDEDYWTGQFNWYYENGQKSEEAIYNFGKINGKYTSWYSNGQKKEEVNYINGKKEGCDYKWDENGKSERTLCSSFDCFVDYYKNGEAIYNEGCKRCPCISSQSSVLTVSSSPTNPSINGSSSNGSTTAVISSPVNNFIGHFNNELSVGDYKVFQKFIYYKNKGIDVFSASFQNKDIKEFSELIVNPGDSLVLNLNTIGIPFFRKGSLGKSQAKYSLAIQIEDSTGKEYYSEFSDKEIFQEDSYTIKISIKINPEKLQIMRSTSDLFLNFLIKDKYIKEGILQGFAKFKIQK